MVNVSVPSLNNLKETENGLISLALVMIYFQKATIKTTSVSVQLTIHLTHPTISLVPSKLTVTSPSPGHGKK